MPIDPKTKKILDNRLASGEIEKDAIDEEAKKGGTAKDIAGRAAKRPRKKFTLSLSTEVAKKLQEVSNANIITYLELYKFYSVNHTMKNGKLKY